MMDQLIFWNFLVENALLAVIALIVSVLIVKVYKRTDWFLITIPALMIAYGVLCVPMDVL